MKKLIYLVLIIPLQFYQLNAQNIISEIKRAYQNVNTERYLDSACWEETFGNNSYDGHIETIDLATPADYKNKRNQDFFQYQRNRVSKLKPYLLLNIDVDSAKVATGNYITIDTCKLKFSVISFKKNGKVGDIIGFINNRYYSYYHAWTGNVYYKQLNKGFKRILKQKPQYLLACMRLGEALLYVKNDKIYAYRIFTEDTLELDDYLRKINSPEFVLKNGHSEYSPYGSHPICELNESCGK